MSLKKAYFWPYWLANSYPAIKQTNNIENKKYFHLYGQGQIYIWRALNIYDDFLDGAGKAIDLPRANDYFRRFLKILYTSKLPKKTLAIFESVLTDLEKSNYEEARHPAFRQTQHGLKAPIKQIDFSDLTILSRKSLVLAIMPICCCLKIKAQLELERQLDLLKFFRLALAAKQLADDAADWTEDLVSKKITPVTALVAAAAQTKKIALDLENNYIQLHQIFISSVSRQLAHNILNLCCLARKQAIFCQLSPTAPLLKNLLQPLEENAKNALKNKQRLQITTE